jgi:hypothetical protein
MLSFDTNIAVHAANSGTPLHDRARDFLQSVAARRDMAVCELVLVELYLKLRNEKFLADHAPPRRRQPFAKPTARTKPGRSLNPPRSWKICGNWLPKIASLFAASSICASLTRYATMESLNLRRPTKWILRGKAFSEFGTHSLPNPTVIFI